MCALRNLERIEREEVGGGDEMLLEGREEMGVGLEGEGRDDV